MWTVVGLRNVVESCTRLSKHRRQISSFKQSRSPFNPEHVTSRIQRTVWHQILRAGYDPDWTHSATSNPSIDQSPPRPIDFHLIFFRILPSQRCRSEYPKNLFSVYPSHLVRADSQVRQRGVGHMHPKCLVHESVGS